MLIRPLRGLRPEIAFVSSNKSLMVSIRSFCIKSSIQLVK